MKKPKRDVDKYLEKECRRLDIDPDWYEDRRELYRVLNIYKSAESGRKRRGSAKKEQGRQLRYERLEDRNGETNVPNYKVDRWMWD